MRFAWFADKQGNHRIYGWTNDRRLFIHVGPVTLKFEVGRVNGVRWLELRWGGGYTDGVSLTAGVGFGAWATVELPWSWTKRIPGWPMHDSRTLGLNSSGGRLRLLLGREDFGTYYGQPKRWMPRWIRNRELCLFNFDWIVGRDKVSREQLEGPTRMLFTVGEWPGDEYTVEVSRERMTWRNRVRSITRTYWDVKTPDGEKAPPIPGKGENSWDIDDDGIYGSSYDTPTVEEAFAKFRESVIKSRRRYGGDNWRPRAVAAGT